MRIFQPHASPADRAGDERRRDIAHRSGDSICHRSGTGADQPVHGAEERCSGCRSRRSRKPAQTSARAAAGASRRGSAFGFIPRRIILSRAQFTEPEILRTNLASVILQMKAFGLGEIERFRFIEPPDTRQIRDGYLTLHEIGAVDEQNRLTDIGRQLARLAGRPAHRPDDPGGPRGGCASRCPDHRRRPVGAGPAREADGVSGCGGPAHAKFRDESSDFLTFLHLWKAFHHQMKHLSGSKLRKWCKQNFLSFVRMREWHDVHQQLVEQSAPKEKNRNSRRRTATLKGRALSDE